jgi:hypothetical protein
MTDQEYDTDWGIHFLERTGKGAKFGVLMVIPFVQQRKSG